MRLETLLEDYAAGRINGYRLQQSFDFHARREDYNQQRKQVRVVSRLSDYVASASPEEIVLEQERLADVLALVKNIRTILDDESFNVFWLVTVQGLPQERVAATLHITQPAVSRRYRRALKMLRERFDGAARELAMDALSAKPSIKVAHKPKEMIRYPSEFLSHLCIGGRKGKRVWITNTVCATGDYLDECFGDDKTCCAYCERCKNRKMKERYK